MNFVPALIFSQVDSDAGAHESALGTAEPSGCCWKSTQTVHGVAAAAKEDKEQKTGASFS